MHIPVARRLCQDVHRLAPRGTSDPCNVHRTGFQTAVGASPSWVTVDVEIAFAVDIFKASAVTCTVVVAPSTDPL